MECRLLWNALAGGAGQGAYTKPNNAGEDAERRTRKTTFTGFLHTCHNHLHSSLTIHTDATLSTRGDPANANHKRRPERLP